MLAKRLINKAILTFRLFFFDKSAFLIIAPSQNQAEWKINCINKKIKAIFRIVSVETFWLWNAVNAKVTISHALGFNG